MSDDALLSKTISSSRKVSEDGSLIIYDLTKNVDFSRPKKTAEALANVFFEKDAVNWFKITDDHVDFEPTYKVRIVLAEEHHNLMSETVDDFMEDLQKEELSTKFSPEIRDGALKASRLGTIIAVGTIRSALFRHSDEKIFKDYLRDDLFIDLLENLEIRSPDNKDMVDWKHLPL